MGSSTKYKVPDELDHDFKNDDVKFCENYFKKENLTDQDPQHLEDLYRKCLQDAGAGIFHSDNIEERFGDSVKIGQNDNKLCKIGRYLGYLLDDDCCNIYSKHMENKQNEKRKVDMYQHYFICAVLMNKINIAVALMEKQSVLYTALYAAALLKQLSRKADRQGNIELADLFLKNQKIFERHACDYIKKMYNEDNTNRDKSQNELTKEHNMFGSTLKTVLGFAEYYDIMDFIATTACQTKVRGIWKGNLSNNTTDLQVVYCIFCPVLIFFRLRFKTSSGKETCGLEKHLFGCFLTAIYYFYTAAVTKFWVNMICYFLLLLLFSFFVLTDLHPLSEQLPSISEISTWIWMFNLLIEECRQMAQIESPTLRFKVKRWWSKVWNKFDAVMFAMMALSVALRLSLGSEHFVWARRAYSITIATFILRTWQFFLIGRYTGPKVIMIGEMIKDLLFFVMLFSVVLLSFGILLRANLYPNSKASLELIKGIFYMPYWQIYGELFLDTIKGNDESPCRSASDIFQSDIPVCPDSDSREFAVLALAIYMAFTNIMLLNLLIAMFSNSFQRIQTNAVTIWKFHQYTIVNEYSDRPSLIPPLLILNHAYRLIKYVERKYRCPCRQSSNAENRSNEIEGKMEDNKRTETDKTINLVVEDSSEDVYN